MAVLYSGLHPLTRWGINELKKQARARGMKMVVTSAVRTLKKQEELIRSGRAITPALPGRSTHNYGLSFDAIVIDRSRQGELGQLGESIGLWWGGRFGANDPVHFQVLSPALWAEILTP